MAVFVFFSVAQAFGWVHETILRRIRPPGDLPGLEEDDLPELIPGDPESVGGEMRVC